MSERGNGIIGVRTLPWVLLALSLALNVFFVGGHYYAEHTLERAQAEPAERARLLAGRLGLDDRQSAALQAMRSQIVSAREAYAAASATHANVIWTELGEPEPDMARIDRALDRFWDVRKSLLKENLTAARTFLGQLSDDQRHAFITMAREGADIGPGVTRYER